MKVQNLAFVYMVAASCTRPTDDVKRETKEALGAAAKLVTDTKDDYIAATERRIADIDHRLDVMTAEVNKKTGEAKASADKQLQALKKQKDELRAALDTVRQDTSDAWKDTRRRIELTGNAFEESFSDLKKRLDNLR
jgi:phage-related minor tail protein